MGTTTVKKNYQTASAAASIKELQLPEAVTVAMTDLAGAVKDGLLALAVGVGLQVLQVLMDEDVTRLAGPKGKHDQGRMVTRHGSEAGSVTLGGRRVPVRRPRVRSADGRREIQVATYDAFSGTEILDQLALEKMMAADLSRLDLVALMVDGVHFAEHCCIVALGIGIDGTKHPLGVVEGSTENATVSLSCSPACGTGAWT